MGSPRRSQRDGDLGYQTFFTSDEPAILRIKSCLEDISTSKRYLLYRMTHGESSCAN